MELETRIAYVRPGDEMMIWCEGGPATLKRELFPPPVEINERDGMYVLHDDGDVTNWRYVFVPSGSL